MAFEKQQDENRDERAAANLVSVFAVVGLVLLSGLIVSLYTVLVRHSSVRLSAQECVNQATLMVADELSKIYVEDPVFGNIGLCDVAGDGKESKHITSLNRLYATLATDAAVADKLGFPFMMQLVQADVARARQIQQLLEAKLNRAIDPNKSKDGLKLYERAEKIASSAHNGSEDFVDMRIRLGFYPDQHVSSGFPAPAIYRSDALTTEGQFKTNVAIQIPHSLELTLYETAPKTQLVTEQGFSTAINAALAPSVVQVEASYKITERQKGIDILHSRAAYAMVANTPKQSAPSVLMVSLPQGRPSVLTSLNDLFACNGKSGEWQQATDGDVPGKGHLAAPTAIDGAEMMAGQAAQMAFYHWLRSLGPEVDPDKAVALVERSWTELKPKYTSAANLSETTVNSALTKDMGARAFALIFQSAPNAAGQEVLKNAFAAGDIATKFPKSAIPLTVDADGNCNLAGRNGFDSNLVKDLLDAIYQTNLACMESVSTAKSIASRMDQAEREIDLTAAKTNEELKSTRDTLARLQSQDPQSAQVAELHRSEQELSKKSIADETKRQYYRKVRDTANTVAANATASAQATFDLCSQMCKLAARGIYRVDGTNSFLIGFDQQFTPKTTAVSEAEIYEGSDKDGVDSWTSKQFTVLRVPVPGTMAEGFLLQDWANAAKRRRVPRPLFVLFDSRDFKGSQFQPVALATSPFRESGLHDGQLSFYGQDAVKTGKDPEIGWSVLIRDAVGNWNNGPTPVPSGQEKWCANEDLTMGSCPGLGVEIQVRSPVPLIPDLPIGSSVVNPSTHERSSEIPPTPAAML